MACIVFNLLNLIIHKHRVIPIPSSTEVIVDLLQLRFWAAHKWLVDGMIVSLGSDRWVELGEFAFAYLCSYILGINGWLRVELPREWWLPTMHISSVSPMFLVLMMVLGLFRQIFFAVMVCWKLSLHKPRRLWVFCLQFARLVIETLANIALWENRFACMSFLLVGSKLLPVCVAVATAGSNG